jgi:hypothetical protein
LIFRSCALQIIYLKGESTDSLTASFVESGILKGESTRMKTAAQNMPLSTRPHLLELNQMWHGNHRVAISAMQAAEQLPEPTSLLKSLLGRRIQGALDSNSPPRPLCGTKLLFATWGFVALLHSLNGDQRII